MRGVATRSATNEILIISERTLFCVAIAIITGEGRSVVRQPRTRVGREGDAWRRLFSFLS